MSGAAQSAELEFVRTPLDELTRPGALFRAATHGTLECVACGHRCLLKPGRRGICKVRFNDAGTLRVPWGYVAGVQCDPTEKKPFYHLYPGSRTLTFGMLGCDFHCGYCQNWETSQVLRDPDAPGGPTPVSAERLVALALANDARVIASSYNEPLITAEWSAEVFQLARRSSLACAFVSNGNLTPEALDFLRPHLTAYKIDLKSMRDRNYRRLGGMLKTVLDAVRMTHAAGLWVEIVTLIVPGFNDSDEELRDAARFIAEVSIDIPWHVTAFHPDYRMLEPDPTDARRLLRAVEIGHEAGLRYVYAGNLPGRVGEHEDTRCPHCSARLIARRGFLVLDYRLTAEGNCPDCGTPIPGVWANIPPPMPRIPAVVWQAHSRGVR